jgi:protein lifeguard
MTTNHNNEAVFEPRNADEILKEEQNMRKWDVFEPRTVYENMEDIKNMDTSREKMSNWRTADRDRTIYVTKTIHTLFLQFVFTFGCVLSVTQYPALRDIIINNSTALLWGGCIGGMCTILYMVFAVHYTAELLAVFTIFETAIICCATSFYDTDVVVMAILATAGIVGGLGAYAMTTKYNHHNLIQFLVPGLSCLLFMGLINIVFFRYHFLHTLELYSGTLLFFGYIVFDVQYFLSRKSSVDFNQKNLHIVATLNIYLDVLNIFIRLLEIIKAGKKKGTKHNST